MPSEILLKSGTPLVMTMTSLGGLITSTTSGGCQSAKYDLGTTPRAQQMLVRLAADWTTAPLAGAALEVYVGFSSLTGTSGNVANLSGSDAVYTGYNNDVSQAKRQLTFVGVLSASATTATQIADVGSFTPTDRYVQVVVVNTTTSPLATTATFHSCTLYPVIDEAQ